MRSQKKRKKEKKIYIGQKRVEIEDNRYKKNGVRARHGGAAVRYPLHRPPLSLSRITEPAATLLGHSLQHRQGYHTCVLKPRDRPVS